MKQSYEQVSQAFLFRCVIVVAIIGGSVLRFAVDSQLWLDEALSVNISSLSPGQMFEALRHDGHPPFYYLMLHWWIELFGDGNLAVRSMSGVIALATLPLAWFAGRRYGGKMVGQIAVAMLAVSPFATRYATEARMYSLVTLLALAGWIALQQVLERRNPVRLASLTLISGLLLLTHYWAFYFLASVTLTLAWGAWRGRLREDRKGAILIIASIAGGSFLFLPWLPSFLEQVSNTGTPWGRPVRPGVMFVTMLTDFGGGLYGEAQLLGAVIGVFALLALVARPIDQNRIEIDFRTMAIARPEMAVVALTLVFAVVAGYLSASAFASRYTAIVFPLIILLAARGVSLMPAKSIQLIAMTVIVALGLGTATRTAITERTQAGEIAGAIVRTGKAGDVVAFCPDQLGPAVSRLLPDYFKTLRYPDFASPKLVNWVDYANRMQESDPLGFGRKLDEMAGESSVWLVWSGDYRSVEGKCEALIQQLGQLRPGPHTVVEVNTLFEHGRLTVFENNGS